VFDPHRPYQYPLDSLVVGKTRACSKLSPTGCGTYSATAQIWKTVVRMNRLP
jgi:hypothetical protein